MSEVSGQCGLCKNTKTLKDSHFIPKSIYKIVSAKSLSNNPTLVRGGKSVTFSKQVRAHFLCGCCEEKFNKKGEQHVLTYTYRDTGKFLFQDILEEVEADSEKGGILAFSGNKITKIKMDHFVHFAAGIFWKASAGRWNFIGQELVNNQLGKKYEEEFRRFLLGTSQFPENAILTMSVSKEKEPYPIAIFPKSYRYDGYFEHRFYIPGIEFILWVGNLVPNRDRIISLSHSKGGAFSSEYLNRSTLVKEAEKYLRDCANN